MYVVAGKQEDLGAGLYTKVANYRHKVFVEQLGWQLQAIDNAEQDQFDRCDTIYVATREQAGQYFRMCPPATYHAALSSWGRFSTASQWNAPTQFTGCLGIIPICRHGF